MYVVGADEPQAVTLPPGSSKTAGLQISCRLRTACRAWLRCTAAIVGLYLDSMCVPAKRRRRPALVLQVTASTLRSVRPTWRADGSRLSYRSGLCVTGSISAQPAPGEFVFKPLFSGEHPSAACTWDWGPTPALADQILYTANTGGSSIFRIMEGGTHPGTKVHTFSELDRQILLDLKWLPDGSGFLYSFPGPCVRVWQHLSLRLCHEACKPTYRLQGRIRPRFGRLARRWMDRFRASEEVE